MFLAITTVKLKPSSIDAFLRLFQETNPGLVADQPGWLGAEVAADRSADSVTVIARWKKAESYRAYAASEKFQSTMARFAPHFATPPEVKVLERLWRMGTID